MKVAILGWGSLIWDPQKLPLTGEWMRGGPTLPIEFSRISGGERLTLVIDEECGTRVPTRYALSADLNVTSARESLRKREKASSEGIASIDLTNEVLTAVRSQSIGVLIASWAKNNGFEGVVWTGLPPNFLEKLRKPYSWEAAFSYLDELGDAQKTEAFKYIRSAPDEVQTAFRREFRKRFP